MCHFLFGSVVRPSNFFRRFRHLNCNRIFPGVTDRVFFGRQAVRGPSFRVVPAFCGLYRFFRNLIIRSRIADDPAVRVYLHQAPCWRRTIAGNMVCLIVK